MAGMRTRLVTTKTEWELTMMVALGLGMPVAQLGKKAVQPELDKMEPLLHYQRLLELQLDQLVLGHQGLHFAQQVLAHLGVRVLLVVQQGLGLPGSRAHLVYREVLDHRLAQLGRGRQGRQGSQELQVCLEFQQVLDHH